MTRAALIAIPLVLAGLTVTGCGVVGTIRGYNLNAIKACAKQHPPPPQANVDRLGLVPVYVEKMGDTHDPAVQAWFAQMDDCSAKYQAAEEKK